MLKQKQKKANDREWYSLRSLLGYFNKSKNSPLFALLVGGREEEDKGGINYENNHI